MLSLLAYDSKAALRDSLQSRGEGAWIFVTPFPAKADALRTAWQERPQTEVLTISRFTQDLFETRWGKDPQVQPLRKSHLLLKLNAFKNSHPIYKNIDYGTFKTTYQVFSDLRSFTDAPELPDELLAPFDESVQELVKLFHAATQALGLRDEHAAIFDLTAELRAPEGLELPGRPLLIFEGFTFLTPAQLSFFEALAIRHDVIVPIPKTVLERSHAWDWPQVLKLAAHETLVAEAAVRPERSWQAVSYPASNLGAVLRAWRTPRFGSVQIVLGTKTPSPGALQEIPFADVFTKRDVDVTAEARSALFQAWEERLVREPRALPGSALLGWCQEEKKRALSLKSLEGMRSFKAATLVEEAIAGVPGCLDLQPLNLFLLRLVGEVVALNAPRNSQIPLLKEEATVRLLGLRDVDSVHAELPLALCIDSSLGPIKSDHRPYSPELEKELAKLGPVKRPELDFLFLQAELSELLEHSQLTLFIEEGLLKHDLAWKQVFEGRKLEAYPLPLDRSARPAPDYRFFAPAPGKAPDPERVSASRLQDFLDCPRLYHAKRIEKLVPDVKPVSEIDARSLGDLEHKLIQLAWGKGKSWWSRPENLEAEIPRILREIGHPLALGPVQSAAMISEVSLYARNGLSGLEAMEKAWPGTKFEFERPLMAPGVQGSIDCLGSGGGTTVVIDFKRSKGTNPTFKKWPEFEKVQLWFYLNALKREGALSENIVVGYFFFKDFEESWLAATPDVDLVRLAQDFRGKLYAWEEAGSALTEYQAFESNLRERLAEEVKFLPLPLKDEVCGTCGLRPLCPRAPEMEEA